MQLHCLYIRREPENQARFQPARDVPGTFLEGSLKVLASRTYRESTKKMGTSTRHIRDTVAGRPGDQMMGSSGDVCGTSVILVF